MLDWVCYNRVPSRLDKSLIIMQYADYQRARRRIRHATLPSHSPVVGLARVQQAYHFEREEAAYAQPVVYSLRLALTPGSSATCDESTPGDLCHHVASQEKGHCESRSRIHRTLSDICTQQLDGKRLIELPAKKVQLVRLEFTKEERDIYQMVSHNGRVCSGVQSDTYSS